VKPKIRVGDRNYIFDNYLKIRLAILRKMNAFYLTPVKKRIQDIKPGWIKN